MSEYLKLVDKSQNMEALRNARSYNDVIVVLTRIRSSVSQLQTRLSKRVSNISDVELDVESGKINLDLKAAQSTHEDLALLEIFTYEVKFSRSLRVITSDSKLAKVQSVLASIDSDIIRAKNSAFRYLHQIGSRVEPKTMRDLAKSATSVIQSNLADVKVKTFVMLDAEDRPSLTRYIIVRGIKTKGGYSLSEFLIAIHAQNNFDNTFSFSISFPVKTMEKIHSSTPVSRNTVKDLIQRELTDRFHVKSVSKIGKTTRRTMETLKDVVSVRLENGSIVLTLDSGVTGKEINSILYKALPIVHAAFGVEDPRIDILHRVGVSDSGSKFISFLVSDRNFYDRTYLSKMRTLFGMDAKNFNLLSQLMES